jgi:hypothetical protein
MSSTFVPSSFDASNPFDGFGVKERFADAAKIHTGDRVHLLEAVEYAFKCFIGHFAHGLIPCVAEAGDAVEVAATVGSM